MGISVYTAEGIMAQIWVAFGQGTGTIRVSQEATLKLRELYFSVITSEVVDTRWAGEGVQILERIRAIGRLAALLAIQRGDTVISAEDVQSAAYRVEITSDTDLCPPRPKE